MQNDFDFERQSAHALCDQARDRIGEAAVAFFAHSPDDLRRIVKICLERGDLQPEHLVAWGMVSGRTPDDRYAPFEVFESHGEEMIRRRDEILDEMERVAEEEARAEREQVKASIEGRAA